MRGTADVLNMASEHSPIGTAQSRTLAAALPHPLDDVFHETWSCGHCGREFNDCTSCVAHEEQCGGLTRW
jgi:hypothetical protein